jgi:hypothetical protein
VERVSPAAFRIKKKEGFTIEVCPISVGDFVVGACNGRQLDKAVRQDGCSEYTCSTPEPVGGAHNVKLTFQFMGSEPKTARYEVAIVSDEGARFDLVSIIKPKKSGPQKRFRMPRFDVVA